MGHIPAGQRLTAKANRGDAEDAENGTAVQENGGQGGIPVTDSAPHLAMDDLTRNFEAARRLL